MANRLLIFVIFFSGTGLAGCAVPWLEKGRVSGTAVERADIRALARNVPVPLIDKAQEGTTQTQLSPVTSPEAGFGDEVMHDEIVTIVTWSGARHKFSVEIADDLESQRLGLMFRRELAASSGMLFDFGKSRQVNMWMKNTYIPLDILFIAEDGRIVSIEANTIPHSLKRLSSDGAVKAALEINAGLTKSLGIRPGDRLIHRIFS